MKTIENGKRIFAAVIVGLLFFSLIVSSCKKDSPNMKTYTITGNATGSQVVPAVSGTGTATLSGTFDRSSNMLNYTLSWNGLTGPPTGGGFYAGAAGANGTAVGTAFIYGDTPLPNGSISGSVALTNEQGTELMSGNIYYSISTATNVGGEVRSQVGLQ